MPYFCLKLGKMSQNLLSAAVVIGALRVKPNGISHCYQLEQSISVLRDVGWYFSFFIQILIEHSASKQWRP